MKHVQACFSANKVGESSFHHCGGLLLQACLCAENTLQSRINRLGSAVKHVQACLSASKNLESSFHHYGCPMKLVQACLCAEKTYNAVLTAEVVL